MADGPDGADTGGTLINGRFRPTKRLGSGSFGEIFMGIGTNGEKVAIKFEKAGLRCPQLRHEYKVYREVSGSVGIGHVYHYGTYGSSNVMVMDLLGASLEDLFTRCGRRFSLKTTLKLADQLLERVDAIHSRHLIHRDIKPANFVMGNDTSELCYCIDFGLSKRFRNPHTLAHIPHRVGKSLTGTPRYASINNHLGIEQARRDDLEAIGYVLIYFLKGRLPWQGLKARNASRKYKMIMEKKQSTSINTLCAGCPKEFAEYLSYCRSLKFEASPNIKYLRQLFRDLYTQQGFPLNTYADNDWDWNRITDGNPPAATSQSGGGASGENAASGADADKRLNSKPYGAYGENGNSRPGSAANRPQTATTTAAQGGTSIGESRPDSAAVNNSAPKTANGTPSGAAGSTGNANGRNWTAGQEGGARRPASANGGRSGTTPPIANGQPQPSATGQQQGGDGAYVVAGAKSMMTYRRARSGTQEPGPTGQPAAATNPSGGTGTSGGTGGGSNGPSWGRPKSTNRPKSAGVISSSRVPSGGSTGNASGGRSSGGGARNRNNPYSTSQKAQVYSRAS